MASLNQLISEMSHALGRPNNAALRNSLRLILIQTRNEVIRRSYENHAYVDKILTQRFKVSLITTNDGDIQLPTGYSNVDTTNIKRTKQIVPRPVRLVNNLPFDRVSTIGFKHNREFPYIKETSARFRGNVPGLCGMPCYDYINGYIYIFPSDNRPISTNWIVVESAFEHPTEIETQNGLTSEMELMTDDNEWLLSEDMIGQIKEIIYKRDLLANIKENNEIPNTIKY